MLSLLVKTFKDFIIIILNNKYIYIGLGMNNIITWIEKAWTVIDWLSVMWKSDLSDKIKRVFSKQRAYQYYYMDTN